MAVTNNALVTKLTRPDRVHVASRSFFGGTALATHFSRVLYAHITHLWLRVKTKANKQGTSPRSELVQGETQQETVGRLISFWPLLLGIVSFFFLFLAPSGWGPASDVCWVGRFFR